ncbi:CDGSH iron-sulfur domain-containing protein [Yinghuangia sp. ASG 101]|uniref:CDGSH iron-sulfur domain-containing protein n=1 Tax=Yinghuangia sp. ASG 101 TaxID=2896848 RepID=UPI002F91960A
MTGTPDPNHDRRRPAGTTAGTTVTVVPGGPVLVSGPVDVELPDGSFAHSDRVVTAVCACRRSKRMPWCDTSHRTRRAAPPT